MADKSKAVTKEPVAQCPPPQDLEKHNPQLKHLAGSNYDSWNTLAANQAVNSAWYPSKMDADERKKVQFGLLSFLSGIDPKDQFEGLLAGQLLASHNAAMECYRRAMLPEQTFEGRRENLNQANKLSRTHATLLEALNRHRGKGQQKVTVEHVHVHEGGQAIVGKLISLSTRTKGPLEAIKLLQDHGVILIIERHLPATHLDGAAMLLDSKIPVIGLTLRHDRLDNFWFTLLHELGHIFLHRDRGLRDGFFDEEGAPALDELETEADEFAESAFMPNEVWKKSFVRFTRDPNQVIQFAKGHGISSAVVAGRIRRERNDYTIFNDLMGSGSLKKLMSSAGYLED